MKVSIGVSNRHVHLTKEHLEILFGKGYELKKKKDLNQPKMFASTDTVTIKSNFSSIENVRVLGPLRDYNQVEISKTDSYKLKLDPPVRKSGKISGSSPITLIGPKGELILNEGCIIAERHIHINEDQLKFYNLTGKDKVSVRLYGEKSGIINNVHLRVGKTNEAYFELHIDTDDANAHLIKNGDIGEII